MKKIAHKLIPVFAIKVGGSKPEGLNSSNNLKVLPKEVVSLTQVFYDISEDLKNCA